jgi:transcription initiation factor TFIIB
MRVYIHLMNSHLERTSSIVLSPRLNNLCVQQQEDKSFEEKEVGFHPTTNAICPLCMSNSVIFDEQTGETICSYCATVISDRQPSLEWNPSSNNKMGQPTLLVFPDKGLSTVITNSNTDAYGVSLNQDQISSINKVRYYNKLSSGKNHSRNLKNAFAVMAAIKDKLNLTDPVIERAAYYYRKTLDCRLVKGRSIKEMVVASIYAACKEMEIPRRLEDISEAADANNIFAGRCFRVMSRELNINSPSIDGARYMSKVAENAAVSQRTYRTALNLLNIVKKNPISYGKDPKALATAALYGACMLEEKDKVNQSRIAQAGGISVVTLRKRISDISKTFPEIQQAK